MTEKYKPEAGDRVRVVLEGKVSRVRSDCFDVGNGIDANCITDTAAHVVSIEKVEPPVETFKPGDVVRHKQSGEPFFYSIGREGYLSHQTNRFYEWGPVARGHFTSKHFEKVSLG